MRSDHGTENVTIATCQMAFRHYHGDRYAGANSFIFGSSIRNCVFIYIYIQYLEPDRDNVIWG